MSLSRVPPSIFEASDLAPEFERAELMTPIGISLRRSAIRIHCINTQVPRDPITLSQSSLRGPVWS